MANVLHSALTGAELHEPKGASTANSGEVYVADGLSSGVWTNAATLDNPKVIPVFIRGQQSDGSTTYTPTEVSTTVKVYVPWACTLVSAYYNIDNHLQSTGTASVASTITIKNHAGTNVTGGTVTVTLGVSDQAGLLTCTANNTFTTGQTIQVVRTVGGTEATVMDWMIYLHVNRTA